MATGTAGYSVDFAWSDDDATYTDIESTDSGDFSLSADELDVTAFGDTARDRILGLLSAGGSFSGQYVYDDSGQAAVRDALINRTEGYIRVIYDGTNGFKVAAIITEFSLSTSVDGLTEYTCSFVGRGAPSVVS